MSEVLKINGVDFISYDLLCNIGSLAGYSNIDYLKDSYSEMPIFTNGAYNSPLFSLDEDVDMFLEKDNLGAEAIWLKVGSRLDDEISVCLENEPVLSQKNMKKVENKLIERDALSNYTVLNEAISDLPEKTKKDLSKALSKDNSNFDWKGVIEKSIKESDDFYIQPINGSSEVSIVLHMSNIKKEVFEKEVSKESASIIGVRKKAKP
jgi:hypothetical protein